MPNFPPPLPAGWSEHTAPDGRTRYYYNSNTKESTYTRPSFAPLPQGAGMNGGQSNPEPKEKKKKKEKPKQKVPIPDTTWVRVTTSEGNVFYFETESKKSEWTIPDEIKDEVAAMEKAEQEEKAREESEKKAKEESERLERLRERERIRAEVEEERNRKRKERETQEGDQVTQIGEESGRDKKVAKIEKEDGDHEPEGEDDEEEWKRAVAAEFAEQDAAAKAKDEEEQERNTKAEEEAARKVFAAPGKVNVSVAEGRALFKVRLSVPF